MQARANATIETNNPDGSLITVPTLAVLFDDLDVLASITHVQDPFREVIFALLRLGSGTTNGLATMLVILTAL